jgi:serine O-acetyltransferase
MVKYTAMYLDELIKEFNKTDEIEKFDKARIDCLIENLSILLMYEYHKPNFEMEEIHTLASKTESILLSLLNDSQLVDEFLNRLPILRKTLNTSVDAILEGDPASISRQQIALEYPGFKAILYYRIAHEFYTMDKKMIARYISEKVHQSTGIDINPGAQIGDYFFIDHGTGIVIGETAVLGNHVKLYQGVTLGALSLSKGRGLTGQKRHPTVEDNVTIYSNAAIFGGDTVLGKGSTIGGDVYLTHTVKPNSIVLQTDKNLTILQKD